MHEVFGVIAPHPPIMVESVGGARSDITSASISALAHARSLMEEFAPETIVIMSPHAPAARDAFIIDDSPELSGSLAEFGAPQTSMTFTGDPELASVLLDMLADRHVPALSRDSIPSMHPGVLDHGVLVPMSFLDPAASSRLLTISVSYLPLETHRVVGEVVAAAAASLGRRVAFVASGDCSHRLTPDAPAGFNERGTEFDAILTNLIAEGDLRALLDIDETLIDAAGECGLRSFITLGGFAPTSPTEVLSYEGPWGVGYLTAIVGHGATPRSGMKQGMAGSAEHPLVTLAREAITAYVNHRTIVQAPSLAGLDLPGQAGAFVSLHRNDELRGCIGTIMPTRDTLAEEVIRNAIEAAVNDPRFDEMTTEELEDLDINVDVLHAPEPATYEELDPALYGVIVTSGWHRGLLLPDLEGVNTARMQVDIATKKAGLPIGSEVALERFKVDRYA